MKYTLDHADCNTWLLTRPRELDLNISEMFLPCRIKIIATLGGILATVGLNISVSQFIIFLTRVVGGNG